MLRILCVLELSYELITFYIPGLLLGSFGTEWSPQEPAELICRPRVCVHRSGSVESLYLTACVICSCVHAWSIPRSSLFRCYCWSCHNVEGRFRMFMLEFLHRGQDQESKWIIVGRMRVRPVLAAFHLWPQAWGLFGTEASTRNHQKMKCSKN
jgi:hypothetical protein